MNERDLPQPWPPRTGQKFFLFWMLAEIFAALVERFSPWLWITALRTGKIDWNLWVGQTALLVPAAAWTGYLLFRPSLRLGLWVLLPAVVSAVLWSWVEAIGFLALLGNLGVRSFNLAALPAAQAALLIGIRRRPWAWLVASIVAELMSRASVRVFETEIARRFVEWAASLHSMISTSNVISAGYAGIWLLGAAGPAYVLAFWMPPITRENRTASPPLPGSTSA